LGYPNSSNISTYLKKNGSTDIGKQGKFKVFNVNDVINFAKTVNRQIVNEINSIPENYI